MAARIEFKDTSGYDWICEINQKTGKVSPDSIFWIDENGNKRRVVEDGGVINMPVMRKDESRILRSA